MHNYNFFFWHRYLSDCTQSCRWLLHLCHMLTYGFLEYREMSPSLWPFLSTSFRGFVLSMTRYHIPDHTAQLALPQACYNLVLLGIFLYFWFLLPGMPFSFHQPRKYILVLCVLDWASLSWKALHTKFHALPLCSHRSPGFTPPNTNHHAEGLPVCLHYWIESSAHMSIENTYGIASGT